MYTQKQKALLTVGGILYIVARFIATGISFLSTESTSVNIISVLGMAAGLSLAFCMIFRKYGKPMIITSGAVIAVGIIDMLFDLISFIIPTLEGAYIITILTFAAGYMIGYVPLVAILLLSLKNVGNTKLLKNDDIVFGIGVAFIVISVGLSLFSLVPTIALNPENVGSSLLSYISVVPRAIGYTLALCGLRAFKGNKAKLESDTDGEEHASTSASDSKYYMNILTHILLLLFTCGIWQYVWIVKVTGFTNKYGTEEYRNPVTKLLLCMFVPFYHIYWTYKTAKEIDNASHRKQIYTSLATICTVLSIFIGIVPPILLQDAINNHELSE